MAVESSKLARAKTVVTTVASVAATAMVVRSVIRDIVPHEFQDYFFLSLRKFFFRFSSNQLTLVIEEFDGLVSNEIYEAAECYLGPKITPATRRLKISKPDKEKNFNITVDKDQEILDVYNGEKMKWVWVVNKVESTGRNFYNPRDLNSTLRSEVRSFQLTFHKKNKDMVITSYLPTLIRETKLKKHEKKTVKIHTVDPEQMFDINNPWTSITLDHPATFDTLAMDTDLKEMIIKDLQMFVRRRDYYRCVGKAWKRGYLLYGPPGTGKSSLIAAMANFLNFDIYDLELGEMRSNTDLRKLLVATANKSILVVEDIDCTIDLENRTNNKKTVPDGDGIDFYQQDEHEHNNKVTLSGFLNFIDGLWSSCSDERIIIFTTNHKEKLDPALLRPGRMDVHIHMSYCTPCGFKLLAKNFLALEDHLLFKDIEDLIQTTKVTPAEVAEQLLKQNEPESSLEGLIEFLRESKRKETEKSLQQQQQQQQVDDNDEEIKSNS